MSTPSASLCSAAQASYFTKASLASESVKLEGSSTAAVTDQPSSPPMSASGTWLPAQPDSCQATTSRITVWKRCRSDHDRADR